MTKVAKDDVARYQQYGRDGLHQEDVVEGAMHSIILFFRKKKYFCGGPIPKAEMISKFSIQTVLRTQYDNRTFEDFIHKECLPKLKAPPTYCETISYGIHYLLAIFSDLQSMGIPHEHHPGLILLYFKWCKGIQIPDPPPLS